jgi:hypothetical protein
MKKPLAEAAVKVGRKGAVKRACALTVTDGIGSYILLFRMCLPIAHQEFESVACYFKATQLLLGF